MWKFEVLRLKVIVNYVLSRYMVEIQCPHCGESIELEDGIFGLFGCPFCNEEFEWDPDITITDNDSFNPKDFLIGLFAPASPSIIGILYSLIFTDGWDSLIVFVFSLLIWPLLAIPFLIYGFISKRRFMVFGTSISFILMIILFFTIPIFH